LPPDENHRLFSEAFRDYYTWSLRDEKIFEKINDLIVEITRDPFRGTGKPEPHKHEFKGFWSRRITQEYRLVYEVTEKQIFIVSCEGHYT